MACNSDMKKPQNACEADDSVVNDILTEAVREAIINSTAEAEVDLACGQGASYGNISETRIADAAISTADFVLKIVSDAILVASSKMVVKQDKSTLSEAETTQEASEMEANHLTEIITEALNKTNYTTNTKTSSGKPNTSAKNSEMKVASGKKCR